MKILIALSLCLLVVSLAEAKSAFNNFFNKPPFKDLYGVLDANIKVGDAGDPLILTDLIRQGNIDEARNAAQVDPISGVSSYAGYFRVDETYDSNLFFWLFPSESNYEEDPVILWLQGGPGATSMFGLFQENGPFVLTGEDQPSLRSTSWSKSNSVIYIDQPVGTGFSFTNGGYAQNQTKVADDLYEALVQFFTLFPELQSRNFFITGESYAGKYVPAISYRIHQKNPSANVKINFKGLALGNGLTDPKHQMYYADYLYHHGIVDLNTRDIMLKTENKVVDLIAQERFAEANNYLQDDYGTISAHAGLDLYNYLTLREDISQDWYMSEYLAREDVRKAIHVGNTPFDGGDVYGNLAADILKSEAHLVAELLSYYKVLIYNGQLDIIVAYPMTIDYLRNLTFDGSDLYANANRHIWYDTNDPSVIAGYVKTAGNLTEVLVRNAGHMVPSDQPEWSLDLINKFVRNQPITG